MHVVRVKLYLDNLWLFLCNKALIDWTFLSLHVFIRKTTEADASSRLLVFCQKHCKYTLLYYIDVPLCRVNVISYIAFPISYFAFPMIKDQWFTYSFACFFLLRFHIFLFWFGFFIKFVYNFFFIMESGIK